MRILHIAETIKGGVGTYLNHIVPLQIASGEIEKAIAIVPAEQRSQVAAIPDSNIIAVEGLSRSPWGLAHLYSAVRLAATRLTPNVVHAHSSFAGLVARTTRLPQLQQSIIVYCPHGWAFDREGHRAFRHMYAMAERKLSHNCDAIVAISEFERQRGIRIGIDPSRLRLVLNGLADLPPRQDPETSNSSDGRLNLLFVGRLDRQKGLDILLRAIEQLGDRVSLRVAGAAVVGTGKASVSLPQNVHLLGWLDEAAIAQELDKCDALVVPSRWEGFGLVAIEAMRAARPVVASRVGGLPEVILDGETGVLFTPGDVDELVEVLLSHSRSAWREMGSNGRRRFLERFTAIGTANKLLEIYNECLTIRKA